MTDFRQVDTKEEAPEETVAEEAVAPETEPVEEPTVDAEPEQEPEQEPETPEEAPEETPEPEPEISTEEEKAKVKADFPDMDESRFEEKVRVRGKTEAEEALSILSKEHFSAKDAEHAYQIMKSLCKKVGVFVVAKVFTRDHAQRILSNLTFSEKRAEEMKERLESAGDDDEKFFSVFLRL